MSIEAIMTRQAEAAERQADALESILALLQANQVTAPEPEVEEVKPKAKPAKPKAKPAKEVEPDPPEDDAKDTVEGVEEEETDPLDEPEEKEYTSADVRSALAEYRKKNDNAAMLKVLKDHGATGMGSLDPSKYASVMKACGAE